jgi:hypothetical protein
MLRFTTHLLLLVAGLFIGGVVGYGLRPAPIALSPYVNQQDSPVRGLSAQEVDDLVQGRGAGYARTAELNSYPGPRHLLDAADALALSDTQVTSLGDIFADMEREAQAVGARIVAAETRLSDAFGTRTITEATLAQQVRDLSALYGELRDIHLRAHLLSRTLLCDDQVMRYNHVRGYTAAASSAGGSPHHSTH